MTDIIKQTESTPEGFINEKELRRTVLPLSRPTLKQLRDSGRLPFLSFGRRILYHGPTVTAALLRNQKAA